MKAITLKQTGVTDNLELKELPTPSIKSDEVLIEVKAISINPVDAFVRQHEQALLAFVKPEPDAKNIILGWDVSGVIVETGSEVKEFKKGDEVSGMIHFPGHGKAYAGYVAAPASQIALKPSNISHEEAAAATLAALTAWQSLVTYGKVKKGDKVLIHAAAGGVGHYAIQIAKYFGAYVIGTASASNRDFVLSLGADEFIDYTKDKFEEKVKDADLVLDSIYGDHILRSIEAVKKGGRLISLLTNFEGEIAEKIKAKELNAHRLIVVSSGKDMKELASLLASGKIKSHVSHVFSFADLPKAHLQIESQRTIGKVVVKL